MNFNLETINDPRMTSEVLNPNVAAVIIGFDGGINYWKLMFAASYVQDGLIHFIGTNCDQNFTRSGLILPGKGDHCVNLESWLIEFEISLETN